MVNFDTREGIIKEWNSWIRYYRSGGRGTWPRDAFESLLDYFDEQINQVSDKSSRRDGAWFCSTCKHDKNYGEFCDSCGEPRR